MPSPLPDLLSSSVFIDPGRTGAVALVTWEGGRPHAGLVRGWSEADPDEWDIAVVAALEDIREAITLPTETWIERPGDNASWAVRKVPGSRHAGQKDVVALAMRAGAASVHWSSFSGRRPTPIQQREWWGVWGPAIPPGKKGDGKHRIREAGELIPGAGELLEACRATWRVDAAEALLGAAAMLIRARRERSI